MWIVSLEFWSAANKDVCNVAYGPFNTKEEAEAYRDKLTGSNLLGTEVMELKQPEGS